MLAVRIGRAMETQPASCLDALDAFVELAALLASSPCPPRSWLEDAPLDEIGESAQAFAQRQEKYRRLKETLSQHYTARLFEQDCAALNEALNPTEPHVLQAVKQPSD